MPRPRGNGGGHGKLAGVSGWIDARVTGKGEITLDELVAELAEPHGIESVLNNHQVFDYIAKRRKFIVSKMQGLVLLVQKPCTFET